MVIDILRFAVYNMRIDSIDVVNDWRWMNEDL